MPGHTERRSAPRVPAVPNSARLGWEEGGRPAESAARLIDISRSGALIEAPFWPAGSGAAWVRLVAPMRTDRVPVTMARRGPAGRVAVAFDEPCPTELLWAASLGVGLDHLLGSDAGDGRSRDDWTFGT